MDLNEVTSTNDALRELAKARPDREGYLLCAIRAARGGES
jgi:hypothetical protein